MNTGADFIKKLRPLGCAIVLMCFAAFLVMCFTGGGDGAFLVYEPPQTDEYYAGHIDELVSELNGNVLPLLDAGATCSESDGRALVETGSDSFFAVRRALLEHFDDSLLSFRQTDQGGENK